MSRISSMARFRVAAALEEEYRGTESPQQQPSTSEWDGRRCDRLPSVSKFLAARRRSKSQSRLLDSQFFFRIVTAFDQNHHHHRPSRGSAIACCHHSHFDDSICGRFMRRNRHFSPHSAETPNGTFGGALHADNCASGRLNGLSAISGWDISEESCWDELEGNSELYSSLQMDMPIKVLNGSPGYINILDGLNAWQLVSELADATGQPAAASFKQFSPAGAAIGVPLSDAEAQALMVADLPLDFRRHSLAVALARARGADRMSTFSDFIALSQRCDELTARIISREVSDGVIAPDFDETALSMLAKKKNGNYVVLKIDPKYLPAEDEVRTVFGLKLKQKRNAAPLSAESFADVAVGDGDQITAATVDDLLVACVAVKYAQSNAVCFAHRGQVIGIGAGQQTRLNCTRLAGEKSANWWFRQHPRVLSLPWRANVRRSEKANVVDAIVADVRLSSFYEEETNGGEMSQRSNGVEPSPSVTVNGATMDQRQWDNFFSESVAPFTAKDRREWLASLDGVCVASESPFNSRDNIDLAKQYGAKFVVTPREGAKDEEICEACEERSITLIHTANAQTMR